MNENSLSEHCTKSAANSYLFTHYSLFSCVCQLILVRINDDNDDENCLQLNSASVNRKEVEMRIHNKEILTRSRYPFTLTDINTRALSIICNGLT